MQRARSLAIPRAQQIAILNVDVLDVELNSPVRIGPTELDQSLSRAGARRRVGEESPKSRLIEALIDDERHHFHVVRLCQGENARIELTEHDSKAVDRVHLGAEDRDLVDVLEEALVGILFVDVVKEALECLRVRSPRQNDDRHQKYERTKPSGPPAETHQSSAMTGIARSKSSANLLENVCYRRASDFRHQGLKVHPDAADVTDAAD